MARQKKYPDELMERGVRLVFESGRPVARVPATWGSATRCCASACAGPRPTPGIARTF